MNIHFCGEDFLLHPSGSLYWSRENMLIVSDLHLEKGSSFAHGGFFLPPYDSHHTLLSLQDACEETNCQRLLFLGDSFHDDAGYHRLSKENADIIDQFRAYSPVWVRGNHDSVYTPSGFNAFDEFECRGLTFRHIASRDDVYGEISGHYHPKIYKTKDGAKIVRACFIEDGRRMVLPAIGAYTGGLSVTDPSIKSLFTSEPNVYALGNDRVYKISYSEVA